MGDNSVSQLYTNYIREMLTRDDIAPAARTHAYLEFVEQNGFLPAGITTDGINYSDGYGASFTAATLKKLETDGNYILNDRDTSKAVLTVDTSHDSFFIKSLETGPNTSIDAAFGYSDLTGAYHQASTYIDPYDPMVLQLLDLLKKKGVIYAGMSSDNRAIAVYNYIVNHFDYIADHKGDDWNFAGETIAAGGGDCEDLSILLNSLGLAALMDAGMSRTEADKKFKTIAGTSSIYGDHVYVEYTDASGKVWVMDAAMARQGEITRLNQLQTAESWKATFTPYFSFNDKKVTIVDEELLSQEANLQSELRAGKRYNDPNNASVQAFVDSLVDIGLISKADGRDRIIVNLFNYITTNFEVLKNSRSSWNFSDTTLSIRAGNAVDLSILFINSAMALFSKLNVGGSETKLQFSYGELDGEGYAYVRYRDEAGFDRIIDLAGEMNPSKDLFGLKPGEENPMSALRDIGFMEPLRHPVVIDDFDRSAELNARYKGSGVFDAQDAAWQKRIIKSFNPELGLAKFLDLGGVVDDREVERDMQMDYSPMKFGDQYNDRPEQSQANIKLTYHDMVQQAYNNETVEIADSSYAGNIIVGALQAQVQAIFNAIPGLYEHGGEFWTFKDNEFEALRDQLRVTTSIYSAFALVAQAKGEARNLVEEEMTGHQGYKQMNVKDMVQSECQYIMKACDQIKKMVIQNVDTHNKAWRQMLDKWVAAKRNWMGENSLGTITALLTTITGVLILPAILAPIIQQLWALTMVPIVGQAFVPGYISGLIASIIGFGLGVWTSFKLGFEVAKAITPGDWESSKEQMYKRGLDKVFKNIEVVLLGVTAVWAAAASISAFVYGNTRFPIGLNLVWAYGLQAASILFSLFGFGQQVLEAENKSRELEYINQQRSAAGRQRDHAWKAKNTTHAATYGGSDTALGSMYQRMYDSVESAADVGFKQNWFGNSYIRLNREELLGYQAELASAQNAIKMFARCAQDVRQGRNNVHQEMTGIGGAQSSSIAYSLISQEHAILTDIMSRIIATKEDYVRKFNERETKRLELIKDTISLTGQTAAFTTGLVMQVLHESVVGPVPVSISELMSLAALGTDFLNMLLIRDRYKPPLLGISGEESDQSGTTGMLNFLTEQGPPDDYIKQELPEDFGDAEMFGSEETMWEVLEKIRYNPLSVAGGGEEDGAFPLFAYNDGYARYAGISTLAFVTGVTLMAPPLGAVAFMLPMFLSGGFTDMAILDRSQVVKMRNRIVRIAHLQKLNAMLHQSRAEGRNLVHQEMTGNSGRSPMAQEVAAAIDAESQFVLTALAAIVERLEAWCEGNNKAIQAFTQYCRSLVTRAVTLMPGFMKFTGPLFDLGFEMLPGSDQWIDYSRFWDGDNYADGEIFFKTSNGKVVESSIMRDEFPIADLFYQDGRRDYPTEDEVLEFSITSNSVDLNLNRIIQRVQDITRWGSVLNCWQVILGARGSARSTVHQEMTGVAGRQQNPIVRGVVQSEVSTAYQDFQDQIQMANVLKQLINRKVRARRNLVRQGLKAVISGIAIVLYPLAGGETKFFQSLYTMSQAFIDITFDILEYAHIGDEIARKQERRARNLARAHQQQQENRDKKDISDTMGKLDERQAAEMEGMLSEAYADNGELSSAGIAGAGVNLVMIEKLNKIRESLLKVKEKDMQSRAMIKATTSGVAGAAGFGAAQAVGALYGQGATTLAQQILANLEALSQDISQLKAQRGQTMMKIVNNVFSIAQTVIGWSDNKKDYDFEMTKKKIEKGKVGSNVPITPDTKKRLIELGYGELITATAEGPQLKINKEIKGAIDNGYNEAVDNVSAKAAGDRSMWKKFNSLSNEDQDTIRKKAVENPDALTGEESEMLETYMRYGSDQNAAMAMINSEVENDQKLRPNLNTYVGGAFNSTAFGRMFGLGKLAFGLDKTAKSMQLTLAKRPGQPAKEGAGNGNEGTPIGGAAKPWESYGKAKYQHNVGTTNSMKGTVTTEDGEAALEITKDGPKGEKALQAIEKAKREKNQSLNLNFAVGASMPGTVKRNVELRLERASDAVNKLKQAGIDVSPEQAAQRYGKYVVSAVKIAEIGGGNYRKGLERLETTFQDKKDIKAPYFKQLEQGGKNVEKYVHDFNQTKNKKNIQEGVSDSWGGVDKELFKGEVPPKYIQEMERAGDFKITINRTPLKTVSTKDKMISEGKIKGEDRAAGIQYLSTALDLLKKVLDWIIQKRERDRINHDIERMGSLKDSLPVKLRGKGLKGFQALAAINIARDQEASFNDLRARLQMGLAEAIHQAFFDRSTNSFNADEVSKPVFSSRGYFGWIMKGVEKAYDKVKAMQFKAEMTARSQKTMDAAVTGDVQALSEHVDKTKEIEGVKAAKKSALKEAGAWYRREWKRTMEDMRLDPVDRRQRMAALLKAYRAITTGIVQMTATDKDAGNVANTLHKVGKGLEALHPTTQTDKVRLDSNQPVDRKEMDALIDQGKTRDLFRVLLKKTSPGERTAEMQQQKDTKPAGAEDRFLELVGRGMKDYAGSLAFGKIVKTIIDEIKNAPKGEEREAIQKGIGRLKEHIQAPGTSSAQRKQLTDVITLLQNRLAKVEEQSSQVAVPASEAGKQPPPATTPALDAPAQAGPAQKSAPAGVVVPDQNKAPETLLSEVSIIAPDVRMAALNDAALKTIAMSDLSSSMDQVHNFEKRLDQAQHWSQLDSGQKTAYIEAMKARGEIREDVASTFIDSIKEGKDKGNVQLENFMKSYRFSMQNAMEDLKDACMSTIQENLPVVLDKLQYEASAYTAFSDFHQRVFEHKDQGYSAAGALTGSKAATMLHGLQRLLKSNSAVYGSEAAPLLNASLFPAKGKATWTFGPNKGREMNDWEIKHATRALVSASLEIPINQYLRYAGQGTSENFISQEKLATAFLSGTSGPQSSSLATQIRANMPFLTGNVFMTKASQKQEPAANYDVKTGKLDMDKTIRFLAGRISSPSISKEDKKELAQKSSVLRDLRVELNTFKDTLKTATSVEARKKVMMGMSGKIDAASARFDKDKVAQRSLQYAFRFAAGIYTVVKENPSVIEDQAGPTVIEDQTEPRKLINKVDLGLTREQISALDTPEKLETFCMLKAFMNIGLENKGPWSELKIHQNLLHYDQKEAEQCSEHLRIWRENQSTIGGVRYSMGLAMRQFLHQQSTALYQKRGTVAMPSGAVNKANAPSVAAPGKKEATSQNVAAPSSSSKNAPSTTNGDTVPSL